MVFTILSKDTITKARTGILKTRFGDVETPFFMPVATKASVKYISSDDLEKIGIKAIISNSYILSLKPGEKIIQNLGGIGKFMSFKGAIFTDSGGFQMYSPKLYIKSNYEGVFFRNPFSGEKVFMTPEKSMEIQQAIGSDVAMCLDSMPLYENSKEEIEEAVKKTTLWAKRCKKHHDKLQKNKKKKQLLFGITQGGVYKELRKKSTEEISKINFDGYAIGGLALGEPKEEEYEMIKIVKSLIPENKPIYLMGAGDPTELMEAIALGCDIFDSRFPTKNARHGTLFTWQGKLSLTNSKYKSDDSKIDSKCDCFVCKNYSRAYLHNLLWHNEGAGLRLVSYHNLFFLNELMKKTRNSIKEGKFYELLEKIRQIYR